MGELTQGTKSSFFQTWARDRMCKNSKLAGASFTWATLSKKAAGGGGFWPESCVWPEKPKLARGDFQLGGFNGYFEIINEIVVRR